MFRRSLDTPNPEPRDLYSLNDEGIRTFRGIAWGVLLSIPLWAGLLWIGQKFSGWFS
jgi:hypothetical protein